MGTDWLRDAILYQIYPQSFADSDGDGIGDLLGVTAHLEHLSRLGVNTVWFNPKNPITHEFAAAFKKRFPKDEFAFHGINASYTFDAILIAADAFKRARSTDPKALAEAIRQTNIPATDRVSFGGPIKFDAKGQVEGNRSVVIQNLHGKPTVVLPADFAEGKLVFPMPKVS